MKRLAEWWVVRRNRLTFEVFVLRDIRCRVTRRRGEAVMLEVWMGPDADGAYPYFVRSDL